jgi:hypothetical protein
MKGGNMDKQQLGTYIQIGAIVAGVITALLFIKTHPIPLIILAVEAGVYFLAKTLLK